MTEQIAARAEVRTCAQCRLADGVNCKRGKFAFPQDYETRHTDDDFCGPTRRYFSAIARSKDHG